MTTKPIIGFAGMALLASVASAQQSTISQYGVGASIGVYYPTSSQVKNDLGSSFLTYGLTFTGSGRPSQGAITPEYSAIVASGNGNSLFVPSLTYGYEYHFGVDGDSSTLPYARPFVGAAFFIYNITDFGTGINYDTERLGLTYGIEAGILVGKRLRLTAAYNFFTPTDGFSFNGLSLSATVTLFQL